MLAYIIFVAFLISSVALRYNPKMKAVKNSKVSDLNYEIPKWVKKHFRDNIPKTKSYVKRCAYIPEEEATYNALVVCKLPLGLLQKSSHI